MGKRDSPNRRKSIAVTDQNKPAFIARSKRRAHSIVPGDRLSPLARARRSLAPRKSILKGSVANFNGNGSQQSSQSTASQPFNADDQNATQSMDLTTDFQYQQDNTSRRSLGRRVSFAAHARVRLFQHPNPDNTNSTGTPPSSPSSSPDTSLHQHGNPPHIPQVNDENDYPGALPRGRRSSLRYSVAPSEDMELSSDGLGDVGHQDDSAIVDEALEENELLDDIDAPGINGALMRRRSSIVPPSHPQNDEDISRSEEVYPSDDTDRSKEHDSMEFTIPINRSLRPAQRDEAWLALQRITHSGSADPYELGDDAETSAQSISVDYKTQEDSYDDPDVSHDIYDENQTINISKVLGWPSQLGSDIPRMSIGGESNMDESEIYGPAAVAIQTAPQPALPLSSQSSESSIQHDNQLPRSEEVHTNPRTSVFQPPPADVPASRLPQPNTNQAPQDSFPPQSPRPFTFTAPKPGANARPTSPSKIPVFKPMFTAAFAPPVTKPTPKKTTTDSMPPNLPSITKRPRPVEDDGSSGEANMSIDFPSPAKRQVMAGKWPASTPTRGPSLSPSSATLPQPKPLSPSKKAPFQQSSTTDTSTRTGSLRRPSGYFARRKSLAVGVNSQSASKTNVPEQSGTSGSHMPAGVKAGLGFRRASVGSGSTDAWKRFDKNPPPAQGVRPDLQSNSQKPNDANKTISSTQSTPPTGMHSAPDQPRTPTPSQSPAASKHETEKQSEVSSASAASPARRMLIPQPTISLDLSDILQSIAEDVEEAGGVGENVDFDNTTVQWRDGTGNEDPIVEEVPTISIEQFFAITGIKFMDELTAPRRSTHPSHHHPTRQVRDENEITLAEYFTAMAIDVPQLELYTRVARDLEAWMQQSRVVYSQAEEEAAKITPELFTEYSRADEEGKAELLHQLNLIRTNVRAQAKSDWYEWKLQWVQGLQETADKAFSALEEDAKTLEDIKAKADGIVPTLEREYESVMRELEQERAEVAEIEGSDQDYLNELKSTIAEQNIEVEALQAELAEGNSRLQRLEEKLEEIEVQKSEASTAIQNAQRVLHVQKNSTRTEIAKLKNELETLEDLHMFHATRIEPDLIQYTYNSQFEVTIPCHDFIPIVTQVDVTRVEGLQTRYKDLFPKLSDFFLEMAKRQIVEGDDLTAKQVIHHLADYWASCTQLRFQLKLLSIKFPVDIEITLPTIEEGLPSFKAHTTVLFPVKKAKAIVSFVFSTATFCYWPITFDSLDCEVTVKYGPVDRGHILKCVVDRLSQATPTDNHACLLDACIEAQEAYNN